MVSEWNKLSYWEQMDDDHSINEGVCNCKSTERQFIIQEGRKSKKNEISYVDAALPYQVLNHYFLDHRS